VDCKEIQKLIIDSVDNENVKEHVSLCGECRRFLEDMNMVRDYAGEIEKTPVPGYLDKRISGEFRKVFSGDSVSPKRAYFSDLPKPVKLLAFSSFFLFFGLMVLSLLVLKNGLAETILTIGKIIIWQNIVTAFFIPLIVKKFKKVQLINGDTLCQIQQIK